MSVTHWIRGLALTAGLGAFLLVGCSDDDEPMTPAPPAGSADASMILSQGLADGLRQDAVSFAFTVMNAGDDSSGAVTVLDTLPDGLTFDGVTVARVSSDAGEGPCQWDDEAGVLRCDFGSLDPDESHTVTVDATANRSGSVTHRIWLTEEGEDPSDPIVDEASYAGWGTVKVSFDHVVGGSDLELDQLQYTNAAGNDFSVRTLHYIVSDVTVTSSSGRVDYGDNMAHYRDAREPATRTATLERVPLGAYDFLSFTFGMDEEDNRDPTQGGTWPQTPEWEAMRWPADWGGGYHYMKLEGDFMASGGGMTSFATHTGREHHQTDTNHPSYGNPRPHFIPVDLALTDLEIQDGEVWDIQILMDVNEWYQTPNVYDLNVYPQGMMMNSTAQDLLQANGESVFTLGTIELEAP